MNGSKTRNIWILSLILNEQQHIHDYRNIDLSLADGADKRGTLSAEICDISEKKYEC